MSKFSLRVSSARTDRVEYLLLDPAEAERNRELIEAAGRDLKISRPAAVADASLDGMSELSQLGDWDDASGHDWKIELHLVG
jgi:hypothetical protein